MIQFVWGSSWELPLAYGEGPILIVEKSISGNGRCSEPSLPSGIL